MADEPVQFIVPPEGTRSKTPRRFAPPPVPAPATNASGLDNGDERPKLLPASACDYTTGYNGAYGVLLLARAARDVTPPRLRPATV